MEEKERRKWRGLVGDIVSARGDDPGVIGSVLWLRGLRVRPNLRDTKKWYVVEDIGDDGGDRPTVIAQLGRLAAYNTTSRKVPESVVNDIADLIVGQEFRPMDAKVFVAAWSVYALEEGFASRVWHALEHYKLFAADFPEYFVAGEWDEDTVPLDEVNDTAVNAAIHLTIDHAVKDGVFPILDVLHAHGFDDSSLGSDSGDVSGVRVAEVLRACQKLGMRHGRDLLVRYDAQCRSEAEDYAIDWWSE